MSDAERQPDRAQVMKAMRGLSSGHLSPDDVPADVLEALARMTRQTPEGIAAWGRRKREREAGSPRPGSPAPDFELELLSAEGKRTGERRRLSAHRGRPVALIFGSYT